MRGISQDRPQRGFSTATLVTTLAAFAALLAVAGVLAPASASAMSKIEEKVPDLPPIERMPELPPVPSLPSVPSAPSDPSSPPPPPSSDNQTPGQAGGGSIPGGGVIPGVSGAPSNGGGGWRVFPKRVAKSRSNMTRAQRAAAQAQVRRLRACAKHSDFRLCTLGYRFYDQLDSPEKMLGLVEALEPQFMKLCEPKAGNAACKKAYDAIMSAPDSPLVDSCVDLFRGMLGLPFNPTVEMCQAYAAMSRPWPGMDPGDGTEDPVQMDLERDFLDNCIDVKAFSKSACEKALVMARRMRTP